MTTFEKIAALKPNGILDVMPESVFSHDAGEPEGKHFTLHDGNCYEWYWALGRYYKPSSVLEIGVRYGYSAAALCGGGGVMCGSVTCIDNEQYVPGSLDIAQRNILGVNGAVGTAMFRCDSQKMVRMPTVVSSSRGLVYERELVSIDGDHSCEGTRHDLNLTLNVSRVVVVDDYNFLGDVRRAVDRFIGDHSDMIQEHFVIPSFRGTAVIQYKQ